MLSSGINICMIKYKINATVTDYYLELIAGALKIKGVNVEYSFSVKDAAKKKYDYIMVSICTDAFYLKLHGKKYIYWSQGVWPEENFMKHHDYIRFWGYSFIEYVGLKHSSFMFFVSNALKEYYEQKYRLDFKNYYIMPCSNESFHSNSFHCEDKYQKNTFCYAGGISAWQCFEETLQLYKIIEDKRDDVQLLLLVKDKEKALELVKKYRIKKYVIDFVPVNKLEGVLKTVKFGFLLREKSTVNSVATPTKMSTYLVHGIIPIYSDCLDGISEIVRNMKFSIEYHNDFSTTEIEKMMDIRINSNEIERDFFQVYEKNYNRQRHIKEISEELGKMLLL